MCNEYFTPPLPYSAGASFPPAYQGTMPRNHCSVGRDKQKFVIVDGEQERAWSSLSMPVVEGNCVIVSLLKIPLGSSVPHVLQAVEYCPALDCKLTTYVKDQNTGQYHAMAKD